MEKIIIAAVAENGVIGREGGIPWHYPEDLQHFREVTLGHPVVMGRSTYQSLPEDYRPLPGRTNIVLTRSGFETDESVEKVNSLDQAWQIAGGEDEKVYIIGGESVYEQVIGEADRMIITRIHSEFEGETFFPEVNWDNWEEVSRDERDEISFVEYTRA